MKIRLHELTLVSICIIDGKVKIGSFAKFVFCKNVLLEVPNAYTCPIEVNNRWLFLSLEAVENCARHDLSFLLEHLPVGRLA